MILTNVLRALCVVLLGAYGHHNLLIAVGLAFLVACCAQPFIPAEAAAIPLVVGKEHLLAANSLFATTMIGSIIVAFTLGEPMIQWLHSRDAAMVIGAGFLISVGFLFFVRYRDPDQRAAEHGDFLGQLKEGLRFVWQTRAVRQTLAQQTALFAMFAAMSVLAIIFAKQELQTNFSWFLATAGAGLGVGSWLIGHFGTRWNKNHLVVGGFLACGLVLASLAFLGAEQKLLAFGVALLLGLSSAFVGVPLQTRLQELVPEPLRGKAFGAQNMVLNIATTVPIAAVGFMVDVLGIRVVLGLTAGLMLITGLLTGRTFRHSVITPPEASPAAAPEP
jgi:predicted MFS family arabinose efflux permease